MCDTTKNQETYDKCSKKLTMLPIITKTVQRIAIHLEGAKSIVEPPDVLPIIEPLNGFLADEIETTADCKNG